MTEIAMHGHGVRGMRADTLRRFSDNGDPGKFGRMFRDLVPLFVPEDPLLELATAMEDKPAQGGNPGLSGDNQNIPAGYTYLGQFVDHDITLDTTPLEQQHADPDATKNFRTPALDLDSVYGDGPGIHPYLYDRDEKTLRINEKLLIGKAAASGDGAGNQIPELPNDLPRNQVGHALIFDERNDENLLVAQFHLLMLKFHNAVVDDWLKKKQPNLSGPALFAEARRIVTWHYQWIVLFDFVERLTESGFVTKIKERGRQFYRFRERPYMPAEFAAAAYRLGHSMVRETYNHNRVFNPIDGTIANGTLELLFFFTGKSGQIIGEVIPAKAPSPNLPPPQARLPSNWIIDWRRFFDIAGKGGQDFGFNHSRLLDPFIAPALHKLPGLRDDPTEKEKREAILPFRNLRRGVQIGLPSGQDVCRAMGLKPMSAVEIGKGPDGAVAKKHKMTEATPLWYYVLKEAQHFHQGVRLGPMASLIVAETFLGLVHGDQESFLYRRSNWKPELPSAKPGHFTMADLIRFVGDVNPIGPKPQAPQV
jgi:hypothetical protein